MVNAEIFQPYSLYCDVGKTQATVLVPAGEKVGDNTMSHVMQPCSGCCKWSVPEISKVEAEIISETLQQFGTDDENYTGIIEGRVNLLDQHLVDLARFIRGAEHKLVVAMCTPIGAGM